jgi:hypothetical protein
MRILRSSPVSRTHTENLLTMNAIAEELGLSVFRVSRLIARAEEAKGKTDPVVLLEQCAYLDDIGKLAL